MIRCDKVLSETLGFLSHYASLHITIHTLHHIILQHPFLFGRKCAPFHQSPCRVGHRGYSHCRALQKGQRLDLFFWFSHVLKLSSSIQQHPLASSSLSSSEMIETIVFICFICFLSVMFFWVRLLCDVLATCQCRFLTSIKSPSVVCSHYLIYVMQMICHTHSPSPAFFHLL